VFYSQTRVGRNGKPFTIYKIRTMINNCEVLTGARWSMPGDPRITPVGWFLRRTHIDELPQLWNVLRGEMSLVGPRPERPEFVPRLEETIANYSDRLLVKPGLTGLAQVQLPPDTDLASVQRKLAYDLYYIQHAGFWLEARIYVATALHLVAVPFQMIRLLCALPQPELIEAGYHQIRLRSGRSRDNNGDQQFVRRAVS
jgi:lipopolysaccharide/colanic/teichoic acid biosynthesis glycosyltransferase